MLVECMRRPTLDNSQSGDAEAIGRVCFAGEIDLQYVDAAVRRWQAFIGKPATLLASGQVYTRTSGVVL